jgi:hypothetical protein
MTGTAVTAGAIIPISPVENSPPLIRTIAGTDSAIEEVPSSVEGQGSERFCRVAARRIQHPGDQFDHGF